MHAYCNVFWMVHLIGAKRLAEAMDSARARDNVPSTLKDCYITFLDVALPSQCSSIQFMHDKCYI